MIRSASFVIVGAGIHGLSTAYHLAQLLAESGRSPEDVLVLDKGRVGGGATGISGGIVRNFYLSMPMNELVRQSVEIFEIDPPSFGFHQVGYVAVVPEAQAAELEQIATQHARIGYLSELSLGSHAVRRRMRTPLRRLARGGRRRSPRAERRLGRCRCQCRDLRGYGSISRRRDR